MVENMINFINDRVLKFMNFSDRMKIYFEMDDGSKHYQLFTCDNIKYLYEKFSNNNWDIVSDNICLSEGSDLLIVHINYRRITFIEFIVFNDNHFNNTNIDKNSENDKNNKNNKNNRKTKNIQTRGGSFFKYVVKSKVDLTKFQIIKELNENTAKIIDGEEFRIEIEGWSIYSRE